LGIWTSAKDMAAKTPPTRNRYVDFLRAVSILVVVIGHWMIATAWFVDGQVTPGHLLKSHPQFHWLTWIFQVMPVFFIVGGYSNAVSLESADRKGVDYAGWLAARLHRLVAPMLVLFFAWAAVAFGMHLAGVSPAVIIYISKSALIPTWFLAIYVMLVILAPPTYRLWRRFGFASFLGFAALAVAVDIAFFMFDQRWIGWTNYFWVWIAVHQLGFAWRDGRLGGPVTMLAVAAFGFVALYFMINAGPYPMAMVGSPDEGLSNTLPPKATLLALALLQCGMLIAVEGPLRRALDNLRLWAATVLVNSMIMTLYLWHKTVLVIIGSALVLLGGYGLRYEPGTSEWWWSRPLWIGFLLLCLFPVAVLLSPLERRSRPPDARIPPAAQQISGAAMICLGVACLILWGFGGGPRPWADDAAIVLVVVGSFLSGLMPLRKGG
jgi:peptidoglycan/LPS O-acetylase OafA/YrhL